MSLRSAILLSIWVLSWVRIFQLAFFFSFKHETKDRVLDWFIYLFLLWLILLIIKDLDKNTISLDNCYRYLIFHVTSLSAFSGRVTDNWTGIFASQLPFKHWQIVTSQNLSYLSIFLDRKTLFSELMTTYFSAKVNADLYLFSFVQEADTFCHNIA